MRDDEANVALIKHINKRIEEFFEEYPPEKSFESLYDLQNAFARYVRMKERSDHQPKMVDGVISQHVFAEDVGDEHSQTLAFVKMFSNGSVGILWSSIPFTMISMPDELREMLVRALRFHADRLESRDLDREIERVQGKQSGAA